MKDLGKGFVIAVPVYVIISVLVFGDPFAPINILSFRFDHLGAPFWQLLVVASIVLAAYAASKLKLPETIAFLRFPLGLVLAMTVSIVLVGVYAEWMRRQAVVAFSADFYVQRSFFHSLRNVQYPAGFHVAALKNCKPYAWSYRDMAFHEVPEAVFGVLPHEWLVRCGIKRAS
jgi:hypothetical protein